MSESKTIFTITKMENRENFPVFKFPFMSNFGSLKFDGKEKPT